MSNRVFQSVINQMKDATDRQIGVIDDLGYVVACNEQSMIGTQLSDIVDVNVDGSEQVVVLHDRTYRMLGVNGSRFDCAAFVKGADQLAASLCIMMGVALNEAKTVKGQPSAIVMKTVKGKDVSFMENLASWHGVAPNKEQYEQAMAELNAKLAELEGN